MSDVGAEARSANVDLSAEAPRANADLSAEARSGEAQAIVQSEHLSKWYGQVSGLNDVTVKIPPGITGLLGPNGAGKSTFMKLMTGQLKPSKGSIRIFGEPIWGNPKVFFRMRLRSPICGLAIMIHDTVKRIEGMTSGTMEAA